jgi:hypothetical protein
MRLCKISRQSDDTIISIYHSIQYYYTDILTKPLGDKDFLHYRFALLGWRLIPLKLNKG